MMSNAEIRQKSTAAPAKGRPAPWHSSIPKAANSSRHRVRRPRRAITGSG